MKKLDHVLLLFVVIVLEGYVVLSAELLAIRQTIPFVGSGTDTVSIIIAAVLMPLAFGYYAGGRFKPGLQNGRYKSVRKKLIFNILVAQIILLLGLSYILLQKFFVSFIISGINHRLLLTSIYAALFLVTPVYLLGQTIPLVSNYFARDRLAHITGRILFFSTLGSFLGAVFSTIVLMAWVGVNNTAAIIFVILAFLVILLSKKKFSRPVAFAIGVAAIGVGLNSNTIMRQHNIVEINQYNTIAVVERNDERHLFLNNNASSKYTNDGRKYPYIELAERLSISPILNATPPKDILVIGTGAFTFGFEDTNNNYDYVDIDKSLRHVAEEHILKEKLSDNKTFFPLPARAFLTQESKKYDVVFLDTYFGRHTMPEHLLTQEFFMQIKEHLKPHGIVLANFVASPNFSSRFSRRLDNTFRSVFPHVSRHVIRQKYVPWNNNSNVMGNILYIHRTHPDTDTQHIYTDNKNRAFLDKPQGKER